MQTDQPKVQYHKERIKQNVRDILHRQAMVFEMQAHIAMSFEDIVKCGLSYKQARALVTRQGLINFNNEQRRED